jgi:hypothetical protein
VDPGAKSLRLAADPYAQRSARDNIIPPTWDKNILGEWPWKPVWEEAARILKDTRCLIVIGYSVPATDLTSQALIRSSLSGGSLRLLVVANPDSEARARVIDLARGAITSRTRILEVSYLTDFVRLLDMTPEEERDREQTARRLRTVQRRIRDLQSDVRKLDDRSEDLEYVDVDSLEDRVDALESHICELESARD